MEWVIRLPWLWEQRRRRPLWFSTSFGGLPPPERQPHYHHHLLLKRFVWRFCFGKTKIYHFLSVSICLAGRNNFDTTNKRTEEIKISRFFSLSDSGRASWRRSSPNVIRLKQSFRRVVVLFVVCCSRVIEEGAAVRLWLSDLQQCLDCSLPYLPDLSKT